MPPIPPRGRLAALSNRFHSEHDAERRIPPWEQGAVKRRADTLRVAEWPRIQPFPIAPDAKRRLPPPARAGSPTYSHRRTKSRSDFVWAEWIKTCAMGDETWSAGGGLGLEDALKYARDRKRCQAT